MDFQGFQNTLPLFLVISLIVVFIALSFFTYRDKTSIPILPRLGLIAIRSVIFIIVILLFLNPYFFSSKKANQNPKILVLLDNTESVTINKGQYNGLESYLQTLEALNFDNSGDIDFEYFSIGANATQIPHPDSLNFKETETNFLTAITQVQELESDFDAAIFVSDGIITYGKNPIITASDLSIPIFTVGLGDTSKVRDIIISNVVANPVGFTETNHGFEIDITQNGYANKSSTVRIFNSSRELIDQQQVSFSNNQSTITATLEAELETSGLQQFEIVVDSLESEWSVENNSAFLSVSVTDSKTKVLHLAFEVHPDVKMIRSILNEDENIELQTLTWINNQTFIEPESPEIDEMDLIIVHGLPDASFNIGAMLKDVSLPMLYFHLPKTRKETPGVPLFNLIRNSGNQLLYINLAISKEHADHPILEVDEIDFAGTSPLIGSLGATALEVDAINLFKSVFQGIETPSIVVSVLERGNSRRATVSSWGWYLLFQSPIPKEKAFVVQFFTNLINWTSNDPDKRLLKLSSSKSVYTVSEQIILNANLTNENGDLEENAIVEISLLKDNDEPRTFNMENVSKGLYKLELSNLDEGLYSFNGVARKGNRKLDSQDGEFLVQNSKSELINTIKNEELLRGLATETGGSYVSYPDVANFWKALNDQDLLSKKEVLLETYTFPVRSFFWFAFILLLLAIEWITRKIYSLP